MSPPSRNQVMNMPKPRPPSPHSLRCSLSSAWRQRAAAKPTRVTTANMMMTMVSAWALPLMSVPRPPVVVRGLTVGLVGPVTPLRQPAEQIGGSGQDRDDRHPHELVPVEEREVPERRGEVVVERHPQRADHCRRQQDRYHDPGADVLARGAVLGHRGLFHASTTWSGGPRHTAGRARCDVCRVYGASPGAPHATVCHRYDSGITGSGRTVTDDGELAGLDPFATPGRRRVPAGTGHRPGWASRPGASGRTVPAAWSSCAAIRRSPP